MRSGAGQDFALAQLEDLLFLLILILGVWICRFSKPLLSPWMFFEIYRGLTYYLVFSGLGIIAIWWVEQSWLAKSPKEDERIDVSPQ